MSDTDGRRVSEVTEGQEVKVSLAVTFHKVEERFGSFANLHYLVEVIEFKLYCRFHQLGSA